MCWTLGGTEVVGIYILPRVVSLFRRLVPTIDVNLLEADTAKRAGNLLNAFDFR
jgi:hypothetical protein